MKILTVFTLLILIIYISGENFERMKRGTLDLRFLTKIFRDGDIRIFKSKEAERKLENESDKVIESEEFDQGKPINTKESGHFDFIGRDIINGVGKAISNIRQGISNTVSGVTKGLDSNRTFFSGVLEKFKERVQAIYPGTKWCGDGNKSKSDDDLGRFFRTDICCREHDLCPNNIAAGQTKYSLVNNGLFTRSHCDCDQRFYECLKEAGDITSRSIGLTYFTILGPQCFKEDYMTVRCSRSVRGKCLEYDYDTEGEKLFQWFDNPMF